jgi:hypothetical protein
MAGGNNVAPNALATGSGGAFVGTAVGSFGLATTSASGTGAVGAGNNQLPQILGAGSGGSFTGSTIGVFGYATTMAFNTWGGYFNNAFGDFAYVGGDNAGTAFKIIGPGLVSTIVERPNDNTKAIMFAPEAPEILFQDYGSGKLVNGRAYIELDPIFSNNIHVDENHPLRVFIQLEGDCSGVSFSNQTANGFEVVKLMGGTSNVEFSWSVTANRADRKDDQGNVVSKHQGIRFPDAPGPMETQELQLKQESNKQIESTNHETSSKSRRKREVQSIDRDVLEVNPMKKE